jgi:hypothetical protein
MSARRFAQWMWYEQVEPFGELRADYRAAQVVATVRNVAVTSEHQKTVEECLLKFEVAKKQPVAEQILALNILAHAFSVPGVD